MYLGAQANYLLTSWRVYLWQIPVCATLMKNTEIHYIFKVVSK